MQKLKRICILLLSVIMILGCSFSSYADLRDLMIATGSNALMTLDLNDDDYGVSVYSSLGSVENTVDLNQLRIAIYVSNGDTGYTIYKSPVIENNKLRIKIGESDILDGYHISTISLMLKDNSYNAFPPSGNYKFSFDLSNHFNFEFRNVSLYFNKAYNNASSESGSHDLTEYTIFSNGEAHCSGVVLSIGNISQASLTFVIDETYDNLVNFDADVSLRFEKVSFSGLSVGSSLTSTEADEMVSSSLSDLSSSVGEMTEEIGGITEAIQNLQGAMEPHYNNVLTQLHHITEQLHAFYDQIYNNIHLKEYALWQDIKAAIENIDLEVNVNLDNLKTSIDNMSVAVQNKLQSTTDQITGGYDNSGLESDKSELDGVLNQYEQAEEDLFEDAKGNINDFEFDTPLDAFTGPLSDVSYFLSGLFNAMGPMNVVITFSLTLTIAMVMIGWYRFKGGR